MGKVPLKLLEHQARQNLSTINFTATFARTASSCNTVKCEHSIKATFKKVKSQIQKGANPEKALRRGYDNAFNYFEIMNKRILIQQRALACLSKSVAHLLQRELHTMGNTGLLRQEAEMTLLQPHLGDSRHSRTEELALLAFSTLQVSVSEGWRRLPPLKILRISPHHNKKRGSYRKRTYEGNSSQSSN